ncbi:hypothetical protein FIU87_10865 [Bacillus sp. THAF10]|uniref:hypothetical protein n=1 Tax=Bacillus sp. THAF10 TaxID=2587848 RepID=UPI001268A7B3|nr:hypothetical protein [Bacillus sp. THAF10]QFT89149.1 hypothetical protein FIU87_10865 [Bacillus sp. THAF10]
MLAVYLSVVIFIVSVSILVVAYLSFRKKSEPTFQALNTMNERITEEKEAIQLQMEKMKEKQTNLKNDLDWKKSVFQFTLGELKKLPYSFKSSTRKKHTQYDRSM